MNTQKQPTKKQEKKRGILLTILLIVLIVLGMNSLLFMIFKGPLYEVRKFNGVFPLWTSALFIPGSISEVIFPVAIWNWKKWGIYGLFICNISLPVIFLFLHFTIAALIGEVIFLTIFVAFIYPKWSYFE